MPRRSRSRAPTGVDAYNDITPRVGVAYDVFGNGKTAVKFNLGHYLAPATNDSRVHAEQSGRPHQIVTTVARNWADGNGNYVVDCDILNPAAQTGAGGDTCGALTGNALNFGKTGQQRRAGQPGRCCRAGACGRTTGSGASTCSRS